MTLVAIYRLSNFHVRTQKIYPQQYRLKRANCNMRHHANAPVLQDVLEKLKMKSKLALTPYLSTSVTTESSGAQASAAN